MPALPSTNEPFPGQLRSEKPRFACAGAVAFVALLIYWATLAPTVTLVDSGELIVAASSLGVAHPPGFPLYVLLAYLATLFPAASVAVRVNFFSALCAALASGMLTLTVFEAMIDTGASRLSSSRAAHKKKKGVSKKTVAVESRAVRAMIAFGPAIGAGLLMAFSRTLWAYATIAEVYTLNALLSVAIFFLLFRWRRKTLEAKEQAKGSNRGADDRLLNSAAFLFGLALGVHHVTVGLCLLGYAALVYGTEGLSFFRSKRLPRAALFSVAGLSIYLYLPLAAGRSPVMNWGDPRTLQRLWQHVTGKQYSVFLSLSPDIIKSQFDTFIQIVLREFGPGWLPLALLAAIAGLVYLFRRNRPVFFFLLLIMTADVAYSLIYEIAEDKDAYYLPAFTCFVIAAAFGVRWLLAAVAKIEWKPILINAAASLVLVALPVAALAGNLSFDNKSQYFIAHDYVDNILNSIEADGMLLTLDWQIYSPMLYVREIERRRRDVIAIDISLLRRSWYYDYLKREYPRLMIGAKDKVDEFMEDLLRWDQDPDLYQRDQVLNQRINSRFIAMVTAFVEQRLREAPVYCAQEIPTGNDSLDGQLTKLLSSKYQFVPNGLVFRVYGDHEFHEPPTAQLVTRGLWDGTLRFERDDTIALKVRPVYLSMTFNQGRYLAAYGRHRQAIETFQEVLNMDYGYKPAQQAIVESEAALMKTGSNPR